MPKEIGISNKDLRTYLKDDPSESKLPTNSLFEHLFFTNYVLFLFIFPTILETHNFVWLLGSNTTKKVNKFLVISDLEFCKWSVTLGQIRAK